MAALYLHIPFCSKACHYCNFHFSTSMHRKAEFVEALHKELRQPKAPEGVQLKRDIATIYFGGGTPSLLTASELEATLRIIYEEFEVDPSAEVTLEANPDDISPEKLHTWRSLGINRLSMGVQSFRESDLKWMNRAHSAGQALQSIDLIRKAGFENFTIDLIYGLPTMELADWQKNLKNAAELQVPHLSCYALTVEEKTALHHFITKGKVPPISDEQQSAQFLHLMETTEKEGWEQYEISNFARPGMRSRHNSSYWQGKPYYGFGPSAHSFDGQMTRWWNLPNNSIYIKNMEADVPAHDFEILTPVQRLNEQIMTQLRTIEGLLINPDKMQIEENTVSEKQWKLFEKNMQPAIANNHLMFSENRLKLTLRGRLYADAIASNLFFED